MQAAYDGVAQLQATDDCNICLVHWGTMHEERCKFFKTNGGTNGHCVELVARFLRFARATSDGARMVSIFAMAMKRCEKDMGVQGVLSVINEVHELTDRDNYIGQVRRIIE
jgi:hypothetical protein